MGHDISGYLRKELIKENESDEGYYDFEGEVAYLRRGAFGDYEYKIEIYKALNAEDCYAGCSGNGDYKEFTYEEIDNALQKSINENMESDIIQFLQNCKDAFNKDINNIIVYFG